jgi:hypothetical protein
MSEYDDLHFVLLNITIEATGRQQYAAIAAYWPDRVGRLVVFFIQGCPLSVFATENLYADVKLARKENQIGLKAKFVKSA